MLARIATVGLLLKGAAGGAPADILSSPEEGCSKKVVLGLWCNPRCLCGSFLRLWGGQIGCGVLDFAWGLFEFVGDDAW